MMNKYLLTIGLVTSILFAEFDEIPYDWSGQDGVISNYGNLMWNKDWQIGVLLFNGSFSNYPTRFGTDYRNNFNIKKMLEAEIPFPVLIENDVNLGALGIKNFGVGKKARNMLAVFVGTGIGGGLIIDGKLYRG